MVENTLTSENSAMMTSPNVLSSEPTIGVIRKLDEIVINKIAAGEVVQRPANALKEMLENSLDAGAKNIQIVVKAGGLKLLQIQDDGCGIRKDDLPIVCQRFTTSKLETFEDLQRIETYGFRGEALASISHVAHVAILTKTADSPCAYRAEYANGELKAATDSNSSNPRACAGNVGTTIIVEDLFFNMDTRRRALKSSADEHNKIVDVVTKYAVHNSLVGFSLKKFGETSNEVRTPSHSSHLDNIKMLFGVQIARELVPVTTQDTIAKFVLTGLISNVNYSMKKQSLLLFINNRLVDSLALRKAIDAIYTSYLPKGSHPFLYLSLKIEPRNVDVNVHPTKHEVHFLHEDLIISSITRAIENVLLTANQSRTFYVKSLLPNVTATASKTSTEISRKRKQRQSDEEGYSNSQQNNNSRGELSTSVSAKHMVRTDPKVQKLDKFLVAPVIPTLPECDDNSSAENFRHPINDEVLILNSPNDNFNKSLDLSKGRRSGSLFGEDIEMNSPSSETSSIKVPKRREIKLMSIRNLRQKFEECSHDALLELVRNLTFVGCVDRTRSLIQHETKLFMINTYKLSIEFFYQKILRDFGNFGRITFSERLDLRELVGALFQTAKPGKLIDGLTEEDMKNQEKVADEVHSLLLSKARMLDDYFRLEISEDGRLCGIPMLLENYFPSLEGIPQYLINLTRKVDWNSEQKCFESFAFQTAVFYAVQPGTSRINEEVTQNGRSWKWTIEHVLYPEIRKSLLPPKTFAEDSTVIQLTNLPNLYKVFERC